MSSGACQSQRVQPSVARGIDVAQSVDSVQSKALEFLMRDCQNITKFFKLRGLEKMMTWQQLFNDITGMKAEGEVFLSQIAKQNDDEATVKLDRTKYDFPFDFFFKKSCQDKLALEEFGAGVAESDDDDDEDFGDDDGDDEKEGGVKDDEKVAKEVVEDEKGDDDDDDWESIDSDWSIISD